MEITRRQTTKAALAALALGAGGRLFFQSTDTFADEAKTEPELIPGTGTDAAPAWTVYGDKTLMAWKGEGTDTAIYWSTSSKLKPNSGKYDWKAQQTVPGAATSAAPALATLKGAAYLVWKGAGNDKAIYISKLGDGGVWGAKQRAGDGETKDGPALARTGDTLYLAWKSATGGNEIRWSTSTDGGSWSARDAIPGAKTSHSPALASDGDGAMYVAWKNDTGGSAPIWWSKCSDGKSWKPKQKGPNGATTAPSLAVDSNKVVWAAWTCPANNPVIYPGGSAPIQIALPTAFFSKLDDEEKNGWTPGACRLDVSTELTPTLLSTGDESGLMVAATRPNNPISYAPLLLAPQVLSFNFVELVVKMMRTGHASLKDGSDTVYANIGVKIKGKPETQKTKLVGDLTGGTYLVGLGIPETIQDTDMIYLTYTAINSGAGAAPAGVFLENATSKLLNACEKADEAVIQDLTGVNLSWLSPQEAGALVGAQLGSYILPGFGTAIGALAGWFSSNIAGFFEPNCDGPVAVGVFAFSAPQIRATMKLAGGTRYYEADDHPGITSQAGCGDNSNYIAGWDIHR